MFANDECRIDDRMQPIPADMHGSVTRTPLEKIQNYEDIGMFTYQTI